MIPVLGGRESVIQLVLSYITNVRPTQLHDTLSQREKKNQNPEKSSGKDRQAELRQKLNALWSRGSWERLLCPVKCAKRSRGTRLQVCIVLSVLKKINDLVGSHSEATRELLTALYLPRGTSCSRGNEVRLGQHLVPLP